MNNIRFQVQHALNLGIVFSILINNMRVLRRVFGEKADHDTTFRNLHHWTLIVAEPIKEIKLKCAREQDCRNDPTNPDFSKALLSKG